MFVIFERLLCLSYCAGDLAAGFPLRRDLKGCFEFQAQTGCPARRR
jgi:hypothetical protein